MTDPGVLTLISGMWVFLFITAILRLDGSFLSDMITAALGAVATISILVTLDWMQEVPR